MKLGVLDQTPLRRGMSPAASFGETIALAQAAEDLGYHRYWVAEHHGSGSFVGAAPEILLARLGAETRRIRIGSGGVLLGHYSPLKVAETFRVLETLYPGRIDLGIGRAPGADAVTSAGLAYGSQVGAEYFPTRVVDLMGFLGVGEPATSALADVRLQPEIDAPPEMWLLGSSDQSAALAAQLGLGFSFAHFIAPKGAEIAKAYREAFRPSALYPKPVVSVGVFVVCAEKEEDAGRLAASRDLWRLRLDDGDRQPYPSVEEALSYPYTERERARLETLSAGNVVGTPDQVKEKLEAIAEDYAADELVILTITHDIEARRRSYQLLAEAFSLRP